ncbi:MAG: hypothetical protein KAJ75_00750, partial [Alphaproteobacteria bacterium]|nr:hypothetical protein [Alphaproteobacteria bacterium]
GEISPELKAYSETTFNNTGTGGTQTIDVSKGNKQKITIATSTTTLAFTGWAESGKHSGVVLDIIDGGSQTLILPTQTKLVGDETPDFTPSGRDRFVFTSEDAGTNIDMYVVGLDIK